MASSSRPVARLIRSLLGASEPEALFRREGEFWTVAYDGTTCRLRDLKGLGYLARLLDAPGCEMHALELAAAGAAPDLRAAAPPVLDGAAKAAFRCRLEELGGELEQARDWNDPERAARLEEEIDAVTGELARAAGLGRRDRRLPSPAERARVSVTKAIRTAIRAIGQHHPALAAHLEASIRTGRLCRYAPPGETPPRWRL